MRQAGVLPFLVLGMAMAAAHPSRLVGQEPPVPPAGDTVTLSPAELLRLRQREALERLARPPGPDTANVVPADSLQPAGGPFVSGGRPGAPGIALDMAGDSIMERLAAELAGYEPVQYQGESALFQAGTRDLVLQGDTLRRVMVSYEGIQLTADTSIHLNRPRELLEATGNPVYTPLDGDPVTSRELRVDTRTREASALGAETTYRQGGEWTVQGDLNRIQSDLVFATHARFTSCTLDVPHYHFGANRVKIIRGSVLVAAPVKLYFGDVPVMWLPFIAQSLATGRASGLLTPRFSINDVVRSSGGYQRRISNVGFYWAMSDYTDATMALDWFSGNFTALTTSMRYRWLPKFLSGSIAARRFWRDEGGTEFSVNAQHAWEISERSSMTASVAYVTSTSFLRRNTFDPLEATQQIRSQGGLNRRFDWGQLSLSANRSQSLSDERVDMTLPSATLSLKTITLLEAPANRARWFNNVTWSGGAKLSRNQRDLPLPRAGQPFTLSLLDQRESDGSANHAFGIGNLSLSQDVRYRERSFLEVPRDSLPFFPDDGSGLVDFRESTLDWSSGLSYQQQLVGQTSITPNITFSSSMVRSDTLELAQDFVSGPPRVSFGASLNSHLYGFFPGVGPFEAMRHRISPGFRYQWSPEVEPTELQRRVFGAQTLQPRSEITVSVSQTFEAKRRTEEPEPAARRVADSAAPAPVAPLPDSLGPADPLVRDPVVAEPASADEPRRREQGQVVTLLSLHTSSLTYDFVEADSTGQFLQGFRTSTLRNEVASDYLRGLTLSFEHDLFRDTIVAAGVSTSRRDRSFDPHLSEVNFRFSLDRNSSLFRWLGSRADSASPAAPDAGADPVPGGVDPFLGAGMADEASILPGRGDVRRPAPGAQGRRRDWRMDVSYALTRPRRETALRETSQNVRLSLSLQPTALWSMSWRTSYDVEGGQFSDHIVTLTRDLHRWQAHFDFMKTATGNWAFRFEVSLIDNADLRFDFDQRSSPEEIRLPGP